MHMDGRPWGGTAAMSGFDTERFELVAYDDECGIGHYLLLCRDCPPDRWKVAEWVDVTSSTSSVEGPRLSTLTVTARSHWERVHRGDIG